MKGKPVHHPAVRADAPVVPSSKRLPRLQNRHLIVMVVLAAFLMAACASEPATTSEATATAPSVATSTPLPAPTATPTPDLHQPYSAHTPGPGCHQGGAHWSNPSESYGTVECSSDGTEFTAVTASYAGELDFDWPGHPFPRNYSVDLDITHLTTEACVGIQIRETIQVLNVEAYFLRVCRDSRWEILKAIPDSSITLASGHVDASDAYHMQVSADGGSQQFVINGRDVTTSHDADYLNTDFLSIIVTGEKDNSSVTISNFLYTPKP